MNRRAFDRKLREKLSGHNQPFNEDSWKNMEVLLDKRKGKKRPFFFILGGSVVIILAGWLALSGNTLFPSSEMAAIKTSEEILPAESGSLKSTVSPTAKSTKNVSVDFEQLNPESASINEASNDLEADLDQKKRSKKSSITSLKTQELSNTDQTSHTGASNTKNNENSAYSAKREDMLSTVLIDEHTDITNNKISEVPMDAGIDRDEVAHYETPFIPTSSSEGQIGEAVAGEYPVVLRNAEVKEIGKGLFSTLISKNTLSVPIDIRSFDEVRARKLLLGIRGGYGTWTNEVANARNTFLYAGLDIQYKFRPRLGIQLAPQYERHQSSFYTLHNSEAKRFDLGAGNVIETFDAERMDVLSMPLHLTFYPRTNMMIGLGGGLQYTLGLQGTLKSEEAYDIFEFGSTVRNERNIQEVRRIWIDDDRISSLNGFLDAQVATRLWKGLWMEGNYRYYPNGILKMDTEGSESGLYEDQQHIISLGLKYIVR